MSVLAIPPIRVLRHGSVDEREHALCTRLAKVGLSTCCYEDAGEGSIVILYSDGGNDLLDFVSEVSHQPGRILAIDCSADPSHNAHWRLLSKGASDVIVYVDPTETAAAVASRIDRWNEVDRIASSPEVKDFVIGCSGLWLRLVRSIVEIAAFTVSPILITGESGTGKELVARLVHLLDRRQNKKELVLLDCTTIVPELSGSEFFGHEKGAYTGAGAPRDGAFAQADHGTLFLDEAGELPLPLQAQLLRAVQEKTYKRLGSNVWRETDFRLICATNRDLAAEINRGGFRRDLYYRIASWTCHLPPLRERPEDILPLARHFLRQTGSSAPDFDGAVANYLLAREYPGNIRDLRQIVSRMAYRHTGPGSITTGDVAPEDRPSEFQCADWRDAPFRRSVQRALSLGAGLKEIGRAAERVAEDIVFEDENGNLQRAAKRLGITDRALQLRRQARRLAATG
jgi:transcriptional regulator with GAF, ATPase, and Fis domain